MLPDPLHPAAVHFPIVFMVLLPLAALGAIWAIGRGARARVAWALPLATAAALSLSSWIAVETGESEEEKVEPVVAEASLHEHEEHAERFLALSGVLLVVAAGGLLNGVAGRVARLGTVAGALALAVLGAQVGHTGGELVYRDGAAQAYTRSPTPESGAYRAEAHGGD